MSGGNHTAAHSRLVAEIRLGLGREADLVLWLNRPEHVERYDSVRGGALHSESGLPRGTADLVGILTVTVGLGARLVHFGRWVELEVKTGKGQLRPDQILHQDLVRRRGGFSSVVRSVDEAVAAIRRARAGDVS